MTAGVVILRDRVRIRFLGQAGTIEEISELRVRDPEALNWILRIGAVPFDEEKDSITVELSKARYGWLLASMDDVMDHVPSAVEAEIMAECWVLYE